MQLLKTVPLLALAALALSCTKDKKGDSESLPDKPVITAQKSSTGLLDVQAELRDDGMMLHIGQVPGGSTLECDLDGKPLTPCHDGALFARPAPGDHKITATAMRGGSVTALGETASFTIAPGLTGTVDADVPGTLSLVVDDPAFTNGTTVPLSKDFTAKFRFATKTSCDKPVVKCRYDSRASAFWTACDAGDKSFTVKKDLLAVGLQYLSVQASCSGDQAGPELTLFWYGVPDGYQPLMLKDIKDQTGRHILNLVKDDDCPESQQKYECAPTAQDDFSLCTNGNVIDKPAAGYRVRLHCGDRTGPVVSL